MTQMKEEDVKNEQEMELELKEMKSETTTALVDPKQEEGEEDSGMEDIKSEDELDYESQRLKRIK